MTNVLFICKNNMFRSKVAESFFNKINTNKKNKSRSAGIIGNQGRYYNKNVANDYGVICKGSPTQINHDDLVWADIVVITANNIPKKIFKIDPNNINFHYKLIKWKIQDVYDHDKKRIDKTLKILWKKVNKLVNHLN
ncbi:hypothetical protein COU57_02820 [Candidatus Pacearchaeota archaeon CG10_big_fil_rev_8_21_14_0_10_32_14]|nr:MAG: hypothetical protein COU57_02820 [Candidatus Pacearchaeota archaeon CG10_big_fil_rev_8_21_14_0_10_32_14]